MSTVPTFDRSTANGYPTWARYPMPETDRHRLLMNDLIAALDRFYADQPNVYVSGNLLLFYEKGDKRKHVSPDVMVVKGVPKVERLNYLVWEEGKAPQVVIELTSKTTRANDTQKKFTLYQDVLKVKEYYLFDPFGDYLDPRLQGYRLVRGQYRRITTLEGRLPSKELGLHLEQRDHTLRLWNPRTHLVVPTPQEERDQERQRADNAEQKLEQLRAQLELLQQRNGHN